MKKKFKALKKKWKATKKLIIQRYKQFSKDFYQNHLEKYFNLLEKRFKKVQKLSSKPSQKSPAFQKQMETFWYLYRILDEDSKAKVLRDTIEEIVPKELRFVGNNDLL